MVDHNTLRWLKAYQRVRLAYCKFNNAKRVCQTMEIDMQQESTISYFSNYLFSRFLPMPNFGCDMQTICMLQYLFVKQQFVAAAPTAQAEAVGAWTQEHNLKISVSKSQLILFTPNTR